MTIRWWWIAGFGALGAMAGVGYHLTHSATPQATAPIHPVAVVSTAPPPANGSVPVGTSASPIPSSGPTTTAPAFHVASLNAGTVTVPNGRPTVAYFMSSGCGSCFSGEQQLAHLAATTPKSVQWLSLDVDPGYDSPQSVLAMAHAVGAHWPQAFSTNAIVNAYHVTQLDTVAVIAKNGHLLYDGALPSNAQLGRLTTQANA
ncbi:TlpA family protein disulfide reductase [Sulfobacillus harzensis]|uniref:Thioredoxin domain-containing protein n=1 Tax=Sulfobacillus harzensis TaxID=2729629 RepID=A0A7Y0L378_9FIRM|nr:hypothetical protein [Sulfobacillus harzensis]NMP21555.1 hypothetical protein [Sulfobacillus harzensis]